MSDFLEVSKSKSVFEQNEYVDGMVGHSRRFATSIPTVVVGSEDRGVSTCLSLFLPQTLASAFALVRACLPAAHAPARRRARSPVSPRRTSARASSRAAPPVQRTNATDAGRGGPPLLSSKARREPRLDHLRRARAETREDDRVVAPGARHRPTQHRNVHRRDRCVAGCVTRLARPALRSLANRSRRSMASRVPRKRAARYPQAPC